LTQLSESSACSTFDPGVSQQHLSTGDEIMSYDASIHNYASKSSITAETLSGISRAQEWRSGAIADSAPSRLESESHLAMDRLLRECLACKSPWE
jgi:hypothetical protein